MFIEKSFGVKILGVKMVLLLPDFLKLSFAALFKHKIEKSSRLKINQAALFTMLHEESSRLKSILV